MGASFFDVRSNFNKLTTPDRKSTGYAGSVDSIINQELVSAD